VRNSSAALKGAVFVWMLQPMVHDVLVLTKSKLNGASSKRLRAYNAFAQSLFSKESSSFKIWTGLRDSSANLTGDGVHLLPDGVNRTIQVRNELIAVRFAFS